MPPLHPLDRLWYWFRGAVLGNPLTEIEHAQLTRAHWYPTENPERPWKASVRSEDWVLVVDAAQRATLVIAGREIGPVSAWPSEWTLPGQDPGPLTVALLIAGVGRPRG